MTSVPLSVSQQALWVSWEIDPGQAKYLIPYPFLVTGTLDVTRLRSALREVGDRYPLLRARVTQTSEGPALTWAGAPPLTVTERTAGGNLDAEVLRESRRPFDLGSGPLARVHVLRGAEQTIVLVCVHHIVFDGSSLPVFLAQLQRAYQGRALPAAPAADVLASFARRQVALAEGPEGEPHRSFWRGYLSPSGPAAERTRLPAGPDAGAPSLIPRRLRPDTAGKLARLAGELDVTVFDVLLAAFFLLMRRYLGKEELTIAIPFHGRTADGTRSAIGFFSNVLPIRHQMAAGSAYEHVIRALHANVRRALAHGDLPMATIASEIIGGQGTPPVLFQYWNARRRTDVDVRAVPLRSGAAVCSLELLDIADRAESDFTVMAREDSAGTSLLWKDPDGALGPGLVASMACDYEELLRDIARDPARAVGVLNRVPDEAAPRLELPRSPSVGPGAAAAGMVELTSLPADRLRQVARAAGGGVRDILLAAFAALLSWYTGQDEFSVGATRLRVRPDQPFRDLLRTVAVEQRRQPRSPHSPQSPQSPHGLGRVLFRYADGDEQDEATPAEFDLLLEARAHGNAVQARLLFDRQHFERWRADAMAGHLTRLIGAALAVPDTRVGEFEPLSAQERRCQLETWNNTSAGYPAVALPAAVLRQAESAPAATALVQGSERRSYGELVERAQRMAQSLVARGVGPGDLVGLLLPRGIGHVEAVLGVLFAGAAYLAIDPHAPAERARFILADAGVRWGIADPMDDRVRAVADEHPRLFGLESLTATHHDVPLPRVDPDQPAYCIYTSGTTGRPKGVVISHKNVVRLVNNGKFPFEFGPNDTWVLFHPYSFDVSAWETFACLCSGGTLVVPDEAEVRDSQRFWRLLQRERVTVLCQTPSAFNHLQLVAESDPAPLDHLRYVIFAGEKLQPQTLRRWTRAHPDVQMVNMYGITETTVHSTVRFVTQSDIAANHSNIGVPLPTTTIYLADPRNHRRLLPVGAVGEILVGGDGVAGGYLGRPGLTAERFTGNPFGSGTVFRSGDLARRNPDGTLEFLGRRDDQVKVRGYRVEPSEIETCLREQRGVADAVVLVDEAGDRLLAVIRPDAGEPPCPAARLREQLRKVLPGYMIPAEFRLIAEFPLTANGKLDRQRLRNAAAPLPEAGGRPPGTPTAHELAGIWAELLGAAEISGDSSFFEHGGNSLRVASLVNHIEQRMSIRLPLRAVFDHPRLQELADRIDRQRGSSADE